MTTLYSYVVDHDNGIAPNPERGYCTLVKCKISKTGKRRNIVELAEENDWIIGTGGVCKKSAGHGKIIFAMRVDERLPLEKFKKDNRFKGRRDHDRENCDLSKSYALISQHFFYFGKEAIEIGKIDKKVLKMIDHSLEKKGPNYRRDFNENFIEHFVKWIEKNYKPGKHGEPCGQKSECK